MSDNWERPPITFAEQAALLSGTTGVNVEPMNVPNHEQRVSDGTALALSEVVKQIQMSLSDSNFYLRRILDERTETLDTLIYEPFSFQLDTSQTSFEYDLQPQTKQVVLIETVMAWYSPPITNQVLQAFPNTPPNFAIILPMFDGVAMTLPLTGVTGAGAQFWSSLYSPTRIVLDARLRKLYGSMTSANFPAGTINGMLCGKAVPATLGGKLG